MPTQLADALVIVNDDPISIIPNTLMYTEGLGEQNVRAASVGGGEVEQIYSHNIESNFGSVTFEMAVTIDNIKLARQWKANQNNNLVQIVGRTPDGQFSRTFSKASLLNNYEVPLGSETNITIEFKSDKAI